ncbi:hypothetical protein V2J09_019394 [Rumex salicifolius]
MKNSNPMATDNPGHPNYPGKPAVTPFGAPPTQPPVSSPFMSSGPVFRQEVPGFRPPSTSAPPSMTPYASTGVVRPGLIPPQGPPASNYFQRFPSPQFPPTSSQSTPAQTPPVGPPNMAPPLQQNMAPPLSFVPAMQGPPSYPPQAQAPPVQTGTVPPFGYATAPPISSPAQLSSPQIPSSPYFGQQQLGYAAAPQYLQSRAVGQHTTGPPTGAMQGLVEDFNSLSLGSMPGSMDPGLDLKALPKPLQGDIEPTSFSDVYPLNCKPRYLRLTTSAIPNSQSLLSRWHLPLGAVVCPLAEAPDGEEVPVINFVSTGIVRCRRCRTYVNPYVSFTDGGRKWRCNICALLNDVPGDYFAHLDASGNRIDLAQRPELTQGSVEFVAPTEYMVRPPMPPLYFFLIDVSYSAVRSGMIESSLSQPQMMVVSDVDDIFVPLPDDLLVNLADSRSVIDTFLDSLPSMFRDTMNVESAFGPALKAAFMVMNQLGGKLLIFQNTLPSLGVGRLRLRGEDHRIFGTDKEHTVRVAEDPFYKQMAADFSKVQIGVNVYAFSDKYTDIASLGTLSKYTGGQVLYYPGFQSAVHKEKLKHELTRDLTRETAWEAVLRIRCGKGVRFTSYHGNFMLRSTDLLALPAVDCDKAFAMQLSLEETLLTTQTIYFQVALLYTSSSGERRIRVHTAAAPVVADLGEMYRQADTGAVVSLFARLAVEKTLSSKVEDARNALLLRIVKSLKEYRNLYATQHRLAGRMIYPESLKYLALYGLALCKSTPIRGSYADAPLDERCAVGSTMMSLPVKRLLKLLYPSLIRVDEFLLKASAQADELIRQRLPLSIESLDSTGLYIYDDGFRFVIWIGRMLSPDIAKNLNLDLAADLSKDLSASDNEMSRKLFRLLEKFREDDPSMYQLSHVVRQGEQPKEGFYLLANLIEDQTGGASSYPEWIMQIHRQIQSLQINGQLAV